MAMSLLHVRHRLGLLQPCNAPRVSKVGPAIGAMLLFRHVFQNRNQRAVLQQDQLEVALALFGCHERGHGLPNINQRLGDRS